MVKRKAKSKKVYCNSAVKGLRSQGDGCAALDGGIIVVLNLGNRIFIWLGTKSFFNFVFISFLRFEVPSARGFGDI